MYQLHRETVGLMFTNFRVGNRVEDKETHKRGRVIFVYSELELKGEVIAVLFEGRHEALAVPADSAKSQRGSHECRSYDLPRGSCLSRNASNCHNKRARACPPNHMPAWPRQKPPPREGHGSED